MAHNLYQHFKAWFSGFSNIQTAASLIIALGGGALIAKLVQVFTNISGEWHTALWLLIAGLFLATFAWKAKRDKRGSIEEISVEATTQPAQAVKFAAALELTGPYILRHTFHIWDIISPDGGIADRTFEDCDIYGPAIIVPQNCS